MVLVPVPAVFSPFFTGTPHAEVRDMPPRQLCSHGRGLGTVELRGREAARSRSATDTVGGRDVPHALVGWGWQWVWVMGGKG